MRIYEDEIELILGQHLAAMNPTVRVAWPDRASDPNRPYIAFQFVPVSVEDRTLSCTLPKARGYINLTVVSLRGKFGATGGALAKRAALHFNRGRRFTAAAGRIVLPRDPQPEMSFPDGGDWRTPLRIDYETEIINGGSP